MHQKCLSQRRTCEDRVRPHRTQTLALASGTVTISAVQASQPVVFCYYSSSCQTVRWGKLSYHWWKSDWITCLIFEKYTLKGTCCIDFRAYFIFNMYKYRMNLSRHWPMSLCWYVTITLKEKQAMLRSFLMLNYFIFIYCVGVSVHRGKRTISGSQFSLCTIWVPEIDFSLLGMAASALIWSVQSPIFKKKYTINMMVLIYT